MRDLALSVERYFEDMVCEVALAPDLARSFIAAPIAPCTTRLLPPPAAFRL
jgi:hypothetical protein